MVEGKSSSGSGPDSEASVRPGATNTNRKFIGEKRYPISRIQIGFLVPTEFPALVSLPRFKYGKRADEPILARDSALLAARWSAQNLSENLSTGHATQDSTSDAA
jgi:hypothetical protein